MGHLKFIASDRETSKKQRDTTVEGSVFPGKIAFSIAENISLLIIARLETASEILKM